MIIEGAFLKLPELLLGHSYPRSQYEATLVNHLAMGVLLELAARNIELPMYKIHIEKPYSDISKKKSPGRADLYVDLSGIFKKGLCHNEYGMKNHNWLEAKYFGGIGRQRGRPQKVINAALIAIDLLRLCLFVQETRSKDRGNSRYLVLIFNRNPKDYLAFSRQNSSNREWINSLLRPGEKKIEITLEPETKTFKEKFGNGFIDFKNNFSMKLRIYTRAFEPIECSSPFLYWGFLIRIVDFEISFSEDKLTYKDIGDEIWNEEKVRTQKKMIINYLKLQ